MRASTGPVKSSSQAFFMHVTQTAEVSWKLPAEMFVVFIKSLCFLLWEKGKWFTCGALWTCLHTRGGCNLIWEEGWLFRYWLCLYNFLVCFLHVLPVFEWFYWAYQLVYKLQLLMQLLTCHRCCHRRNTYFIMYKTTYTFSSNFLILDFHFCFLKISASSF